MHNKSSAVAEMGASLATIDMGCDPSVRLVTIDMDRKWGAAVPLFGRGSWVPI